jgi:hypothetical protein
MRHPLTLAAGGRGGSKGLSAKIVLQVMASALVAPILAGCTDSREGALSDAHHDVAVEALAPLEEVSAIRDLALTPSGSVWILNSAAPHILLQDRGGDLVVAFGRTGDGPEDLGFPAAIVAASDSSVTLHDRGRNALRTFNRAGVETASTQVEGVRTLVPSDLDQVLSGSPFGASMDGALLVSDFPEARRPGTAHLWNRQVVRVQLEPGSVEVIADLREERDRFSADLAGASVLVPAPLWAGCPDGTVALYIPFQNEVRWAGGQGVVSTPETLRPLEPDEVEAAVRGRLARGPQAAPMSASEVEAAIPMALEQLGPEISATAPAYVEMLCGPGSVAWLQRFSVAEDWLGRGEAIDLVSPDGSVQEGLRIPSGFRLVRFEGNTLLGVLRDSMDVEQPALLHVERGVQEKVSP